MYSLEPVQSCRCDVINCDVIVGASRIEPLERLVSKQLNKRESARDVTALLLPTECEGDRTACKCHVWSSCEDEVKTNGITSARSKQERSVSVALTLIFCNI